MSTRERDATGVLLIRRWRTPIQSTKRVDRHASLGSAQEKQKKEQHKKEKAPSTKAPAHIKAPRTSQGQPLHEARPAGRPKKAEDTRRKSKKKRRKEEDEAWLPLLSCRVRCAPWGATTCTTSPTHESRTSSVFSFSSSHNLCRRPCSYVVFACLLLPRVISSIFISSSPARFSWAFFLVSLVCGCFCFCLPGSQ